ncbi:hypothetical protein [Fervidibacter sp.]
MDCSCGYLTLVFNTPKFSTGFRKVVYGKFVAAFCGGEKIFEA